MSKKKGGPAIFHSASNTEGGNKGNVLGVVGPAKVGRCCHDVTEPGASSYISRSVCITKTSLPLGLGKLFRNRNLIESSSGALGCRPGKLARRGPFKL